MKDERAAQSTQLTVGATESKWDQVLVQKDDLVEAHSQNTKLGSDPAHRACSLTAIWELLEQIPDPEIPVVSIRELGILRDVRLNANAEIEIIITPTYSGCPAMGQIEDDVQTVLKQANILATVITQLAPAWTTDWMTETAKTKLRDYGIAPPQHLVGQLGVHSSVIHFATKKIAVSACSTLVSDTFPFQSVPCPRCASINTTETSHFASTACKALYKCLDCLEPFDYFKPY